MRSTSSYQRQREWKQKQKDIEVDQNQQSQQSQDSNADNNQQQRINPSKEIEQQNDDIAENGDIVEKKNYRSRADQLYNSLNDFENGVGLNRKRRQIKMEKEELSQLFYELVTFVNNKVNEFANFSENPIQNGKNIPPLKKQNKSVKAKKQDEIKPQPNGVPKLPEETVSIPRKQSIKQQRLTHEKVERSKKKLQIFQNYNKIMSYRFHAQKIEDSVMVEQKKVSNQSQPIKQEGIKATPTSKMVKNQGKTNKVFSVVQQVSLMIQPNFHGISMANSSS